MKNLFPVAEIQITELKEKLSALNVEYKREQNKLRHANDQLKFMKIDLHNVSGLIQEPQKLKAAIKVSIILRTPTTQ